MQKIDELLYSLHIAGVVAGNRQRCRVCGALLVDNSILYATSHTPAYFAPGQQVFVFAGSRTRMMVTAIPDTHQFQYCINTESGLE